MYILMHVAGMPFNGETIPKGESLGGSESAAYYIAKELVKLGHDVHLFTRHRQDGIWDGVHYGWMGEVNDQYPLGDRFEFTSQIPYDVSIIQRHPLAYAKPNAAKINILWLHDLALLRSKQLFFNQRWNIDGFFPVSKWHADQINEVYDISHDSIFPTSNAFDYDQLKLFFLNGLPTREEKTLVYAARPERGLINLVGENGIMEMLPDYKLYVCGYDNVTAPMVDLYQFLYQRCEQLPNVENVGYLSKKDLLFLMAKSKAYVYPTEFEETFCTMVLEANAVGTPFICTRAGALPSTLNETGGALINLDQLKSTQDIDTGKRSETWFDYKISSKEGKQIFADAIRHHCENEDHWQTMSRHALKRRLTWKDVAKQWEKTFLNIFKEKTKDKVKLAKHFEHTSDIVVADRLGITSYIPNFDINYNFYKTGNYKDHYERYYQYEADRGVVYGPEKLHGGARFEQVLQLVDNAMTKNLKGRNKPFRILDYGSAHGHYTMNILERIKYPALQIMGVDLEETNIDKAREWAEEDKCEDRCSFIWGDVNDIPSESKFDLILLGEILEHVPDFHQLLKDLEKHCHDQTWFIITVPYGPWEAIGYHEHIGWRAHIHHFERNDAEDIFNTQKHYKLFAVPAKNKIGSWVIYYQHSPEPYGQIDYKRKELLQAPRETISACIIAKDAENTLAKCLDPILPYMDEVIIGVDKTSSKNFKDFLAHYYGPIKDLSHNYKIKAIEIDSPLEIGFDAARNLTVEKASSDWILWLDADEVVDYPENIGKYLRNNCLNAYSIHQIHVATQPQGLLKVDIPTRIFRNKKNHRFFGFVHEHPETGYNKGMKEIFIIPDCNILHTGYISEKVRRKRFERNFPLMVKDREKYPDRKLGTFLWLRDLTHMNRYERETNGNKMTTAIQQRAKEALDIWRKLLDQDNIRFVVEGLMYYSENVGYLIQNRGFEFKFNMELLQPSSNGRSNFSDPVKGYFINKEDISALIQYMYHNVTKIYDGKYL